MKLVFQMRTVGSMDVIKTVYSTFNIPFAL